jgi:hypothetical protein
MSHRISLEAVEVKVKGFITSGGEVQPTRSVADELASASDGVPRAAIPIAPAEAAVRERKRRRLRIGR